MITKDALAKALVDSELIVRYVEYARAAHPDTMIDEPIEMTAHVWAAALLAFLPDDLDAERLTAAWHRAFHSNRDRSCSNDALFAGKVAREYAALAATPPASAETCSYAGADGVQCHRDETGHWHTFNRFAPATPPASAEREALVEAARAIRDLLYQRREGADARPTGYVRCRGCDSYFTSDGRLPFLIEDHGSEFCRVAVFDHALDGPLRAAEARDEH